MASLAVSLALANPNVSATIVEANEYPDLSQRYHVYGVPRTVVNDSDDAIEGAVPPGVLVERVLLEGGSAPAQGFA